jgi:DNA-binding NarL/FixJ family response regulator
MSTPQPKIAVLIADDHEITRRGIREILAQVPEIEVLGEAQDGVETKQLVDQYHPQILLLDLVMPDHSPIEFERWVRINHPETITLILSAHDRDVYLSGMLEAGAAGYLDKKLRAGELITAIRRAASGEYIFTKEQLVRACRWRQETSQKWGSLSNREREVLQVLNEGKDNRAISASMGIQIDTVEKHLANIYKKLGVNSRSAAIHWWVENNT